MREATKCVKGLREETEPAEGANTAWGTDRDRERREEGTLGSQERAQLLPEKRASSGGPVEPALLQCAGPKGAVVEAALGNLSRGIGIPPPLGGDVRSPLPTRL